MTSRDQALLRELLREDQMGSVCGFRRWKDCGYLDNATQIRTRARMYGEATASGLTAFSEISAGSTASKAVLPFEKSAAQVEPALTAIRTIMNSAGRRRLVFGRDRGVCALCGRNCFDLAIAVGFVLNRLNWKRGYSEHWWVRPEDFLAALGGLVEKWPGWTWEADHILPRSQGGADDLDNLRTLCLICHRRETERLIYGL